MERPVFETMMMHLLVGSVLIIGAYGLSDFLKDIVHFEWMCDAVGTFSLVYLPHGIVLLAVWLYGWMAVPIVMPASLFAVWLLKGAVVFDPMFVLMLLLKTMAAPLAFDIFRMAGIDARAPDQGLNWRVLFLIGLVHSALSNLIRFWMGCCGELTANQLLHAITGSIIGDMVGLFVVMIGAMLFFRAMRRA